MFSAVAGFRFIGSNGLKNGIYLFSGINDVAQGYQTTGGQTFFAGSTGTANGAIITARLDSDNSITWGKDLSASATNSTASNMVLDTSNNMYVVGTTDDGGAANIECYVSKFDSSGALQWQRTIGTNSNERFYDLALVDSETNLMVTGRTGTSTVEGIILKLNGSTGVLLDQKVAGNVSIIRAITTDASGNIYILLTETASVSRNDTILIKMDSSFNQTWAKYITTGSPGTVDTGGSAIGVDSSGNVYVTVITTASQEYFLKFNSSGVLQWEKTFNYQTNNGWYAMTFDSSDNIYLAGDFGSTSVVAQLLKFDSSGTLLWGRGLNGYGGTEDTSVNNISWYNGKILMNGYAYYAGVRYGMLLDVPDDGTSVGTYADGFVWGFSPFTVSTSTDLSSGTASQGLNTSSLSEAAGALTATTATLAITQNILF